MPPIATPDNDRLLRALRREPVDCTPVWLMRQAGRYLPEYRAVRQQAGSFMKLCTTPELACEVTLQPLRRFPLDAAILFSDILTIPDAMGLGLEFHEGEGPVFRRPVRSDADFDRLGVPDPEQELRYVMDAVRTIRRELDDKVPLIGFSGSPWTLATYAVEGGSSKTFGRVKGLMYGNPRRMHQLLDVLARSVSSYLDAQIRAGAQALMLFDTWGGILSPERYLECSLDYMRQIVQTLRQSHPQVPIIVFTKGGGGWAAAIADIGCQGIGLDWTSRLSEVREKVDDRVALQGNIDPAVLYAPPEAIEREVARVLADFGQGPGHVFNLGHGIAPDSPPESVAVLVDAVHRLSRG